MRIISKSFEVSARKVTQRYITSFVIVILQSCLHWYFVMHSITYSSVVLSMACRWFFVTSYYWNGSDHCSIFLSPRSLNTLWSLPMALAILFGRVWPLRCYGQAELCLLILITGQYFESPSDEFASFGAVFHNKNYQWFTNKIALSSKYAFSPTFKLKWHF